MSISESNGFHKGTKFNLKTQIVNFDLKEVRYSWQILI